MLSFGVSCLLGFTQGTRHALEPDHLTAVSTLVAEHKSARASVAYAAAWGLGHATVLFVLGGALLALRRELPARVAAGFELLVAAMLVVLGARALGAAARAWRDRRTEVSSPVRPTARRPLVVGMIHGLAGTGGLTVAVLGTFTSLAESLAFLVVYGLGAAAAMTGLAGTLGLPLARLARRPGGMAALLTATGVLSIAVGCLWAYPVLARGQ
jgi:hypothetical protein